MGSEMCIRDRHNAPAEDAAAQAPVADEQEAAEADEKAEEKSEA